jgi:hypothetical protein
LKINSFFGLLFGAISVLLLIQEGLELGVGAPLVRLLNYYKAALDFFLSWADPLVARFIEVLKSLAFIDLHLNPWWKYLFVPMWLYFFTAALTALNVHHSVTYFIFYVTAGAVVAVTLSAAASTMPLSTVSSFPVLIIAVGFVVFEFAGNVWVTLFRPLLSQGRWMQFLLGLAAYPLVDAVIATVVISVSIKSAREGYPMPAIAQVLCIVVLMAFRNITASFSGATFERKPRLGRRRTFVGYGTFVHGRRVLIAICGAILFAVLGRGLERVGL